MTSSVPPATVVVPVTVLVPVRSSTPEPAVVSPAEPAIASPITRVAAALSTVTVPAVVPKLTGRLSVELPEACEESIVPDSATP